MTYPSSSPLNRRRTCPDDSPPAARRKATFNVQLAPEDYDRLDALAATLSRSRGSVVRELVKQAHQMIVQGIPTCANGQFCPVPNLHRGGPLSPSGSPGQGGA